MVVMKCIIIHFAWATSWMKIVCGIVMLVERAVKMASGTVNVAIHVPMVLRCHVNIVVKNHLLRQEVYRFIGFWGGGLNDYKNLYQNLSRRMTNELKKFTLSGLL
jgi:hypothetical protein